MRGLIWIAGLCMICCATMAAAADRARVDAILSEKAEAAHAAFAETPGQLRFRLISDPMVRGVVLWKGGTRLFPPEDGLGHVSDGLVLRALPELIALRARATPTAWAVGGVDGTVLMGCHGIWQACVLLDATALADSLELARAEDAIAIVSSDASTGEGLFRLWAYMGVGLALGAVLIVLFTRRRLSPEPVQTQNQVKVADVLVDPRAMTAVRDSLVIELSARDLALLRHMADHPGAVLSKDELYDVGWGRDYMPNSRALDQHISTLRRKLDPDRSRPPVIETVHGQGYRLKA